MRIMKMDQEVVKRVLGVLAIIERHMSLSLLSVFDCGFLIHFNVRNADHLFQWYVIPNLEASLKALDAGGASRNEVQLYRVIDWKALSGLVYVVDRVVTSLETIGGTADWKDRYDTWLGQDAGGSLGWYYRCCYEVLDLSGDIVALLKKSEPKWANGWVKVRSALPLDLCTWPLTQYVLGLDWGA